jgi:hypothetical protein
MSRSRRKTSITGITTAESEKQGHRNRESGIGNGDPWLMDKDGKAFFAAARQPKRMRK